MEARVREDEKPFAAAEEKFAQLVTRLESSAARKLTHSDLETVIRDEGREIQRCLLQGHLELRSSQEKVKPSLQRTDGVNRTHHRPRARSLLSLFGVVTVLRMSYGKRGQTSLSPMDAALNLPPERYSHSLRRWAAVEAARGSFDATVEAIARATGTHVPKRQVEELVVRAARDFGAFYARPQPVVVGEPGYLLVLSLDGKGILVRRERCRG